MNSKKIFIIEDEASLLYSLQAKFRIEGFEVMTDTGSEQAEVINKILRFKPGYLILDLILPKVDGFVLLKEIKNQEGISTIPIFIFTNLSDQESRAKGLKLGADYYLVKADFSIDQFVSKIKAIIRNQEKFK